MKVIMGAIPKRPGRTLRAIIAFTILIIVILVWSFPALKEQLEVLSTNPYVRFAEHDIHVNQLIISIVAVILCIIVLLPSYTIRPLRILMGNITNDLRDYGNSYKKWVYTRQYITLSRRCLQTQKRLAKKPRW